MSGMLSARALVSLFCGVAVLLPAAVHGAGLEVSGETTVTDGLVTVTGSRAIITAGGPADSGCRIEGQLQLSPTGAPVEILIAPEDAAAAGRNAALRLTVGRDRAGNRLTVLYYPAWDDEEGRWQRDRDDSLSFDYWSASPAIVDSLAADGVTPRTWHDRWLPLRVDLVGDTVAVWLDGLFVRQAQMPGAAAGPVVIHLAEGDRFRGLARTAIDSDPLYLPVDLSPRGEGGFRPAAENSAVRVGAVPFELAADGRPLNLARARWIDQQSDPGSFRERYDGGPAILDDPRTPFLRLPPGDYRAVHLLAVAAEDPALANALTLRLGIFNGNNAGLRSGQHVIRFDFPARVPRAGQPGARPALVTPAGPLYYVRVPLGEAISQDLDAEHVEVELTREVRLARRRPDPGRFRYRPLGLPSGVRIAAFTLEKAPLQLTVTSRESGHTFVEPRQPTFQVALRNITGAAQDYRLEARATHADGTVTRTGRRGRLAAAGSETISLAVPTRRRGYHQLEVFLNDTRGERMLRRRTSFAVLAPDTRAHRAASPWGTWDFGGSHYTSRDPDLVGSLHVKLGLRYGMFKTPYPDRRRHGVTRGNEFKIAVRNFSTGAEAVKNAAARVEAYRSHLAANPDTRENNVIVFHENAVSGGHATRVPDLFHDRAPYRMNEREQERFRALWETAIAETRAMREHFPGVHLALGNGPLPLKEELYRQGFPAELFDSAGNEPAVFGRPPEAQPPDWVANNASIWMDRQLLDAYGYQDKPVRQCYETLFPSTSPGNLCPETQADYLVRHVMHSLAWEMPQIRFGLIHDVGNSYRFSNWGASGLYRKQPEINPKPAAPAIAVMTRMLDGAVFQRVLELGSPTLYGVEFRRPGGDYLQVLWTIRGRRPLRATFGEAGRRTLTDIQGNERRLAAPGGVVRVTVSPSPVYLAGPGPLAASEPGAPVYGAAPGGVTSRLSPLDRLADWTVETATDHELEYYNPLTPRRRGDFEFSEVSRFEGRANVIRVAPRPVEHGRATMPMYGVLAHREGIELPGTPTEIGLWVNGNGSWGRIIFELEDASGQRWISIGAQRSGELSPWLRDWMPGEFIALEENPGVSDWNTEDVFGVSRINFDGWRYLAFPLPGNYPGGYHWPAGSQWRWNGDGQVHYPLTFRRLIVELPEKTLRFRTFAPVPRPEIYLADLVAGEGDTVMLKETIAEW